VIKSGEQIRLIFAGGGTGGHLYPALAIADRLRELLDKSGAVDIRFVGTSKGIEYRIQDKLGYPLMLIQMQGIARALTLRNLLVPFLVILGLIQSWRLIGRVAPHMVIGTGGYVSWPVLKAAQMRGIPTVIQEQNSFPGIATRRLAGKAQVVYLGFDDARKFLSASANCQLTGNPVRASLRDANRSEAIAAFNLNPNKKTILVFGGSQGAHAINEAVLRGLLADDVGENYQLLWLAGKREYTEVSARAGSKARSLALFPYEHRMHLVYAAADVAIARAGALTLAELEMCGIPAILVPYPHAAGDHQRKNAQSYATLAFATVVDETNLATAQIIRKAIGLIESGEADAMRRRIKAYRDSRPPALDLITQDILRRLGLQSTTTKQQEQYGNS
jgi:UDP-N-acetylglucosamine--N-acetylmuramyl-(pentapeptide) pyrophosphoryl-undecaprenol N-acetylglucosamine transferase